MGQAIRAKADCSFEQAVEILQLEKIDRFVLIQADELFTQACEA